MRRLTLLGPVASVLCAVTLAGCTGCTGCTAGGPHPGTVGAGFAEVLARPAATADYAWYPGSVTEALPSVRYLDGGEAHASELAALGRFTGWESGEPTHPSLEMIDLMFEVDEVIDSRGGLTVHEDGTALEGRTVTVHISIDGSADLDRVADELLTLDDVVLFLNHVGPESWPPPEWAVVFDDGFLGDVHDRGAITWPVAEAIAANDPADSHPEIDATTLDELRAAATEERTIELFVDG